MTEDNEKTTVLFVTKRELIILVNAAGSSQPSKEDEIVQYKLYHKLLSKIEEFK